jgi:hypothetical protein
MLPLDFPSEPCSVRGGGAAIEIVGKISVTGSA